MNQCSKCGNENMATQKFCTYCGEKLGTSVQPPGVTARSFKQGRYTVQRCLGEGAFGRTWLVADENTPNRERRALKEFYPVGLSPQLLPKARDLFEREAQALQKFQHEHIPKFFDFFEDQTQPATPATPCIVQEFIEGESLEKRLRDKGRMTESEVWEILRQGIDIVKYLQERSPHVYHRDVNPPNIILEDSGGRLKVYLIDFGAVKDAVKGSLSGSTIIGKPGYAPAEQLKGVMNDTVDLYGLGATMIETLTGSKPLDVFDGNEGWYLWEDQSRQAGVTFSSGLSYFINSLTNARKDERFADASEAMEVLNRLTKRKELKCMNKSCRHDGNKEDWIYCEKCLQAIDRRTRLCPKEREPIPMNAKYCPNHGVKVG